MKSALAEQERPHEWLRFIVQGREYRWLLEDAGSLAAAAYRLARARCRIQPVPTQLPTAAEVCAAARMIGEATGTSATLPCDETLLDACEDVGLSVIVPVARRVRGRSRAA